MAFFPTKGGFVPAANITGEDHDDLYGGFDYSIDEPVASVPGGAFGAFGGGAMLAPVNPTGYNFNSMGMGGGKPPPTALRGAPPGTALRGGTAMRIATAVASGDGPRPMTSVKGAGFTTAGPNKAKSPFDPLNQVASRGPAPPLL